MAVQETLTVNGKMLPTLMDKLGSQWETASGSLAGTHFLYKFRDITVVGSPRQYPDAGETTAIAQAFDLKGVPTEPSDDYQPEPRLVAVNLHIPPNLSEVDRKKQIRAALALADHVKADVNAPDIPTIFLGDFYLATSAEKRTAVRQQLSKSMSDTEFFKPGRSLDLYNSRNGLVRCPPHVNGVKVDGIFTSDRIAVTGWSMLKYRFDRGCFQSGFPSDHNMISANLWFSQAN
ncbi:hypothetical protein ASD11_14975 [Aeromicrobium sp. Root495]|nr:hypothetical protein ASD11_14975 [Aeromicrobium sp. Root495]